MQEFQFDPRTKGRAYSKGNRQKVALIAALAVPADLYIFDEPTSGLDPLMEVVFRREMARMRDAGATVLLSSHILSEVELLCDRVSIIRAGRGRRVGHPGRTAPPHPHRDLLRGDGCRAPPAASPARTTSRSRTVAPGSRSTATGWPSALPVLAGAASRACACEPPSLEELFLRHYGDDLPDGSTDTRVDAGSRRDRRAAAGDERLRHPAAAAHAPRPVAAADVDRRHGAARRTSPTSASPTRTAPSRTAQSLLATAIANPVIMLFRGLPSGADEGAFMLFLIFPLLAMTGRVHELVPRGAPHPDGRGAGSRRARRGDAGRAHAAARRDAGPRHPRERRARAAHRRSRSLATGLAAQGSFVAGFGAGAVGVAFLGVGLAVGSAHAHLTRRELARRVGAAR